MSNTNSSFNKDGRQQAPKGPVSIDLQERTLRVSNYGRKVTQSILRELFSQVNRLQTYFIKVMFFQSRLTKNSLSLNSFVDDVMRNVVY